MSNVHVYGVHQGNGCVNVPELRVYARANDIRLQFLHEYDYGGHHDVHAYDYELLFHACAYGYAFQ